jgi:hypothetical protein
MRDAGAVENWFPGNVPVQGWRPVGIDGEISQAPVAQKDGFLP